MWPSGCLWASVASQFAAQKRYAEAEPLHKQLLEIGEATLGGNHPHGNPTDIRHYR